MAESTPTTAPAAPVSAPALPPIEWSVSVSPHVKDKETTGRIMWSVAAALAPAGIWSVWLFGPATLYVIALSVLSCVCTEALIQKMRGRRATLGDGSAVVTGLLLAYVLPSHSLVVSEGTVQGLTLLKWYVPVVAGLVSIAIAKHCFGGLGHNIWNPALVGRAFVQLGFAGHVNLARWPWPHGTDAVTHATEAVDAVTRATALAKEVAETPWSLWDLFIGNCPGSLGEVSALLLLVGAAFLIVMKYVDWRLPMSYLLALVVCATLFAWKAPENIAPWTREFSAQFAALRQGEAAATTFLNQWLHFAGMQIFAGGVIIGAFFMATDMVTSPLTRKGQVIFGLGCGALTALIRFYSGYPEGVCYSILLMNTVRPWIDRFTRPRIIGQPR